MRRIVLIAAFVMASALAACTSPNSAAPVADTPSAPASAAKPGASAPAASAPVPAAPVATRKPTPPAQAPESQPAPTPPGVVDRSCRTSADCTIKDVGSCCGTYPACVNVNSPADPRAVQLECARKGMQSTCEVPTVESCTCTAGQCAGSSAVSL